MEVLAPVLLFILSSTLYIVIRIAIAVALLHPELHLVDKIYDNYIEKYIDNDKGSFDREINKIGNDINKAITKGK